MLIAFTNAVTRACEVLCTDNESSSDAIMRRDVLVLPLYAITKLKT